MVVPKAVQCGQYLPSFLNGTIENKAFLHGEDALEILISAEVPEQSGTHETKLHQDGMGSSTRTTKQARQKSLSKVEESRDV